MSQISAPRWCAQVPGVVGFYGAGDVPGSNMIGPVLHDEELFATRRVTCVGQVRAHAWPLAACVPAGMSSVFPCAYTLREAVVVVHCVAWHGQLLWGRK